MRPDRAEVDSSWLYGTAWRVALWDVALDPLPSGAAFHIKLPTVLHGLTIDVAQRSRAATLAMDAGLVPDADYAFYTLDGADFSGYVVAASVTTGEDRREYFEPSDVWPHPMTPFQRAPTRTRRRTADSTPRARHAP